jgi:hypothetical protein
MQSWQLIPFIGIECHLGQLRIGMAIEEVEKIIGNNCFYLTDNIGETGCSIRNYYEYEDNYKLDSIEFFDGSLRFEDIELCNTNLSDLMKSFQLKGCNLHYPSTVDVGQFCPELCIGITCDGDVGGETDDVSHVTIYQNIPTLW